MPSLNRPQIPPVQSLAASGGPFQRTSAIVTYLASLVQYLQNYLNQVYQAVSGNVPSSITQTGLLANRPAFGNPQHPFFYATDNGHLYFDTGTSWLTVV